MARSEARGEGIHSQRWELKGAVGTQRGRGLKGVGSQFPGKSKDAGDPIDARALIRRLLRA